MKYYCYLDTCVFAELLKQYQFSSPNSIFFEHGFLTTDMLKRINPLVSSMGDDGLIVTSSFTFVELANKFEEIFGDCGFQLHSLRNFILQIPEWLIIDEIDFNISQNLIELPLSNPNYKKISGDDAIHLAVAMTRKDPLYFCSSDKVLNELIIDNVHFIA